MFNFNKVTIDPRGYPNPVVFLTTRGFLADPEFIPIEVESELDVPDPDAASDYSGRDLERVGGNTAWRDAIVDTTITALHDNQRVMVFCPSVQSVKDCTAAIRSRGFLAEGIIGTTPLPVRQVIVGRYRQGDGGAMALLNHGVFTAGFDAPKTRCVVLGRTTTSLVLYSQMAGPGFARTTLRRQPDLPNLQHGRLEAAGLRVGCSGFQKLGGTLATELGQQLSWDNQLFMPEMTVQAMRDSRYRHPANAIAELIDNSIDARASKVDLLVKETEVVVNTRRRSRISQIGVFDNGHGMSRETLVQALRFGGHQANPVNKPNR